MIELFATAPKYKIKIEHIIIEMIKCDLLI